MSITHDVLLEAINIPDAEWLDWLQVYDGPARDHAWHSAAVLGAQPTEVAPFASSLHRGKEGELGSHCERDGMNRVIYWRGERGPLGREAYAAYASRAGRASDPAVLAVAPQRSGANLDATLARGVSATVAIQLDDDDNDAQLAPARSERARAKRRRHERSRPKESSVVLSLDSDDEAAAVDAAADARPLRPPPLPSGTNTDTDAGTNVLAVDVASERAAKGARHGDSKLPMADRLASKLHTSLQIPTALATGLSAQLTRVLHTHGGLGGGLDDVAIVDLAKLAKHSGGCTSDENSHALLCGWLRPLPPCSSNGSNSDWFATDVGVLSLCNHDSTSYLAISACDSAIPPPELLGAFIVAPAWALVPAAAGVAAAAMLELNSTPLLVCHKNDQLPPPLPRSFSVGEVHRSIARMGHGGTAHLLHVRGEVVALSGPCMQADGKPIFYVEIADELVEMEACGRGGVAMSCCVAFAGAHAARWRSVMVPGRSYVLTNLRQGRLERSGQVARPLLRSSSDESTHAETRVFVETSDAPHAAHAAHAARAPVHFDCTALASQSQQWACGCAASEAEPSQLLAMPAAGHAEGEDEAPPALISYEGVVTRWLEPGLLELDGTYKLFLSHQPKYTRLGLRVGATITVAHAHVLQGTHTADDGDVPTLLGFGLCTRGAVRIVSHAPLAPANVGVRHHRVPGDGFCSLMKLAAQLTLPELARCYATLLSPAAARCWSARWRGVVSAAESRRALRCWLDSRGLTKLVDRCSHGEFVAHTSECTCLDQRDPLPSAPPLAECLTALRRLPEVVAAMRSVRATCRPQLLLGGALQAAGGAPLPTLLGMLDFEDALSVSQLAAGDKSVVLSDASGSVQIMLPLAEHAALPRGMWALDMYHILLDPSGGHAAAQLHIWTRLFSPQLPFAPMNTPLFTLATRSIAPPPAERPSALRPGAKTIAEVLATPRDSRPWAAPVFTVACVLQRAELMDEAGKLRLHLCDCDGGVSLPLYADVTRLPPGVLAGCGLLVDGLRLRTSQTTGQPYVELTADCGLHVCRAAANDFGTLPPDTSEAAALPPITASGPALLSELGRFGPPLPLVRLLVSIRRLYDIQLRCRCVRCGEVIGSHCRCPGGSGREGELELSADADVTDGSDRATLKCSGRLVWTLLQASPNKIRAVKRIVATSGPLSWTADEQWKAPSAPAPLEDADRAALSALWPATAHWQRQYVAYCMLGSRSPRPSPKHVVIKVGKGEASSMVRHNMVQLIACELLPASARAEVERLQATLEPVTAVTPPPLSPLMPLQEEIAAANPEAAVAALEEQRAAVERDAARAAAAHAAGADALPAPPVAHPSEHPARVYWGVDPLFDAHVELTAKQLAVLPDASANGDVLWLGNHPIRHVSVCGLVSRVHPKHPVPGNDAFIKFEVDDTTGPIQCVRWWSDVPIEQQRRELATVLRLGATIRVHGGLGRFREQRDLHAHSLWPESDGLAERLHMLRVRQLWASVYSRPFRVPSWAIDMAGAPAAAASITADALPPPPSPSPRGGAASVELCAAVLHVLATDYMQATDSGVSSSGLSAKNIEDRLPAAAKALAAGVAVRDAVEDALRQLDEQSAIFKSGRNRQATELWRALDGARPVA